MRDEFSFLMHESERFGDVIGCVNNNTADQTAEMTTQPHMFKILFNSKYLCENSFVSASSP